MEPPVFEPVNNVYYSAIDKLLQNGARITVSEAKKVGDGRDSYICYTVKIESHAVLRRYSDFDSFREALVKLHPTCLVPPLPEKQALSLVTKTNEKSDIVEKRKRHLEAFLNRVAKHPILSAARLFHRFLEAENWGAVLVEEVKEPSKSVFTFSLLGNQPNRPDVRFLDLANYNQKFGSQIASVERNVKRTLRREQELASDLAELGALYRAIALTERELGPSFHKVEATIDDMFLSTRYMVSEIETNVIDPLEDYILYPDAFRALLDAHDQRQTHVEAAMNTLQSRREELKELEAPGSTEKTLLKTVGSLWGSVTKLLDSNPEQTRQENIAKLTKLVEDLEKHCDVKNTELVKAGEAVLEEASRFSEMKNRDMKDLFGKLVDSNIAFYEKNLANWEAALGVVEQIY